MPVETAADQIAILADFGESASYTPVGGTLTTITGIFDNAYEAVDAGGTVPVAITQPHFVTPKPSHSQPQQISLIIAAATFTISHTQPQPNLGDRRCCCRHFVDI